MPLLVFFNDIGRFFAVKYFDRAGQTCPVVIFRIFLVRQCSIAVSEYQTTEIVNMEMKEWNRR